MWLKYKDSGYPAFVNLKYVQHINFYRDDLNEIWQICFECADKRYMADFSNLAEYTAFINNKLDFLNG